MVTQEDLVARVSRVGIPKVPSSDADGHDAPESNSGDYDWNSHGETTNTMAYPRCSLFYAQVSWTFPLKGDFVLSAAVRSPLGYTSFEVSCLRHQVTNTLRNDTGKLPLRLFRKDITSQM